MSAPATEARGAGTPAPAPAAPRETHLGHVVPDWRPPGFLATAWLVARKDLTIEYRTRSAFLAATVFALLAVAIFRFTWDPTAVAAIDLAPGVLWTIFVFSGLLGLHRSFGVEHAERALDALLAAPLPREGLFAGKAAANLVFVVAVQLLAIPAVALFFDLPVADTWAGVALVALLASIGLVAVGTLFAAVTANTRLAELLLPMLALPFFIPVVVPAAQATAALLQGRSLGDVIAWVRVLGAFDLVFAAACTVAFPYTLDD